MKNHFRATALALALMSSVSVVEATGIPVVDVSGIAQMVMDATQQAKQALDQLNQTKASIQQAKDQFDNYKNLVTGNNKLGDFLNDPTLNSVLPVKDWNDIYQDTSKLGELRDRYGVVYSNSQIQASFDRLLSQAGALEDAYNASNQRLKNAEEMRTRLNTVQTPQDREELGLRFQQEQLEIQNQQIKLQNIKMLMDQQEKIADKQRAQAAWNRLEGN